MALLAGCRNEAAPRATPTATVASPPATSTATPTASPTATIAAGQPMWDALAVTAKPEAYFRLACPTAADPARGNPGQVFNLDTPAAEACVTAAMRAAGASEQAQAFLARYHTFLVGFAEHGRVDLGMTSAAWVNMGRPEPVFVNAGPDGMLSLQAIAYGGAPAQQAARAWLARPDVVTALRGQDAIAWPEYARVASITAV